MTYVNTYAIIKGTNKISFKGILMRKFYFTKESVLNEREEYITKEVDKRKGDFIMSTINITNARKDLYNLVENVVTYNEPVFIVGKKGNAVLLSENDWNAIQETIFLNSVPGLAEQIIKGGQTSLEECLPEEKVEW